MVDVLGHGSVEVGLGHISRQRVDPLVDARSAVVVDVSLVAHNACLHTDDVVHRTLLPVGNVATQLHLASL